MDPSQWITGFRELHLRYKAGPLPGPDLAKYHSMREELARSLVAAQGLTVPEGQNARRHFRVAQVLPLEVNNLYKSVTRDVSRAGFSTVVQGNFKEGERVTFIMGIGRGVEPVTGSAHVVTMVRGQGSSRVSFAMDHMSNEDTERLEVALLDAVLSRFK